MQTKKMRLFFFELSYIVFERALMSKKTESVGFRLTSEQKTEFDSVAEDLGITPGSLAGSIIIRYLKARKKHGDQLFFPPSFHTYETIMIQHENEEDARFDLADES
jgi:hypothetical protein